MARPLTVSDAIRLFAAENNKNKELDMFGQRIKKQLRIDPIQRAHVYRIANDLVNFLKSRGESQKPGIWRRIRGAQMGGDMQKGLALKSHYCGYIIFHYFRYAGSQITTEQHMLNIQKDVKVFLKWAFDLISQTNWKVLEKTQHYTLVSTKEGIHFSIFLVNTLKDMPEFWFGWKEKDELVRDLSAQEIDELQWNAPGEMEEHIKLVRTYPKHRDFLDKQRDLALSFLYSAYSYTLSENARMAIIFVKECMAGFMDDKVIEMFVAHAAKDKDSTEDIIFHTFGLISDCGEQTCRRYGEKELWSWPGFEMNIQNVKENPCFFHPFLSFMDMKGEERYLSRNLCQKSVDWQDIAQKARSHRDELKQCVRDGKSNDKHQAMMDCVYLHKENASSDSF